MLLKTLVLLFAVFPIVDLTVAVRADSSDPPGMIVAPVRDPSGVVRL